MRITIWVRWLGKLSLAIFFAVSGVIVGNSSNRVLAQITPDGTLGIEGSIVNNGTINGLPVELIEGGASRGAALFHSFFEFNVGEGNRVYFGNPVGIENIFSRVTGNTPSDILGTLGVNGGANLFLLNPNGIIFGSNAQLDIRGSFVASTADELVFDNGFVFSASNPEVVPLLTLNITPGLQYGGNNIPQSPIQGGQIITANTTRLAVGQDLTLAASNLHLQGELYAGKNLTLFAQNMVRVRDSVINPFLAQAGERLLIQGNQNVDIFALNHPGSGLFSGGDMVLRSPNTVVGDAHYWSGGSFLIEELDGSLGDLDSPNDPIIRSLGDVRFNNYQGSSLHILAGGSVTIPGTIRIISPQIGKAGVDYIRENVVLSNGTIVPIDGSVKPTLDIRAGVDPTYIGIPALTNRATSANINIGIALIQSNVPDGLVFLTNQYQPNPALPGGIIQAGAIFTVDKIVPSRLTVSARNRLFPNIDRFSGNGGSVIIDSRSQIVLTSSNLTNPFPFSVIFSSSASGNAGDITLLASEKISMFQGFIVSDTAGGNQGGDINLTSPSILINDSRILTLTGLPIAGIGGNININTASLNIIQGGGISSNTSGSGKSGDITINTHKLTIRHQNRPGFTDQAGISTANLQGSSGDGGNLTINASELIEIIGSDPGRFPIKFDLNTIDTLGRIGVGLTTASQGSGDAGKLTINTDHLIVKNGAGISTSVYLTGTGSGGDLIVNANELLLEGKGGIASGTLGVSKAGDVIVNAQKVSVLAGGFLSADTLGLGDAGDLIINTTNINISGSRVGAGTADIGKLGKAGNVTVNATESVQVTDGGTISVEAVGGGTAGDLRVETRQMTIENGAGVTVSSPLGKAGNLNIKADLLVLNRGRLTAETGIGKGEGGANIFLQVSDGVILGNESLISAEAFNTANGGNINIDTNFLVGLSPEGINGSDIIANAVLGNGGKVNITAQGIYGIESQPELTPFNDITVSSVFGIDGLVAINSPDVDPSRGLNPLPNAPDKPEFSQNCQANPGATGRFINTGRGGLPTNPYEPITSNDIWEDIQPATQETATAPNSSTISNNHENGDKRNGIVEAQGWIINEKGEVTLVAQMPSQTRQNSCRLR